VLTLSVATRVTDPERSIHTFRQFRNTGLEVVDVEMGVLALRVAALPPDRNVAVAIFVEVGMRGGINTRF
jgi:hypothetical protein